MKELEQYKDFETISEKLMKGECPEEVFLALVGWATGSVSTVTKSDNADSRGAKADA